MEKRMMGPKPEKTTFCSKRSALGGSEAGGEGGAGGVGTAGLEYLSSSGCSSLGNAEKSGELCRDDTVGWKGPPEEEEEEEDEEEDEAEVKLLTPFPLLSFLPL